MYLVFIWGLILFVFLQPSLIQLLNSSILGRAFIVFSVILFYIKQKFAGFVYLLFIMMAINSIPDRMEGFEPLSPEEIPDNLVIHYTDREKTEKKIITPKSSNNMPMITTMEDIEPSPSEPTTTESFLGYSKFP